MNHSEMDDLYELYLLGVLEEDEAAEIAEHLRQNCDYCREHLQGASEVVQGMSRLTDIKPPSPALRERVLSMVRPPAVVTAAKPKRSGWLAAFALAAAAMVAMMVWNLNQRSELEEALRQRSELRSALAILSESDTRTVSFGQKQNDPQGRVFVSGNGGVVFLGNRLPELQAGKTFEFWLIPAKGNPVPSGLFKTNAQGIAVNVLAKSIQASDYAAVAVSVEPAGGSPQPTTKPILIVPLG